MPSPTPREVKMEVLVLGLCRTGTMSMKFALEDLGYSNVYHFSTLFQNPSHVPLWEAALNARFPAPSRVASEIPASLWDELLGSYSAITDIPCACFAPELLHAYPDARLILLTRPTATWHASMLSTIHALQNSPLQRFLLLFASPQTRALSALLAHIVSVYFHGDILKYGELVFETHNESVRRLAKEQGRPLLEMDISDGWEPLCEFLGRDVPEFAFPRVNDTQAFRRDFGLDWGLLHVLLAVGVGAVGVGVWFAFC